MIPHDLGEKIISLAGMIPIVSLSGPWQSGKTTLARAKFPDYAYVNLENLDDRLTAEEDPLRFLRPHSGTGIIVDEVQKVPSLFSCLQGIVDESGETLNEDFFKGLRYFRRLSSAPDEHLYLVYGGDRNLTTKHGQVVGWKRISKLPRGQ